MTDQQASPDTTNPDTLPPGVTITRERNRRYMAWTSLVSVIVLTEQILLLVVFGAISNDTLNAMGNLVDWIFITFGGLGGLYVTAKGFENVLVKRLTK